MIKKSGGNSYYRASPILKMSASDNNITSDLIESMRVNIREQLEAESVEVMDLSGNGRHVAIKVVSEKFEGKFKKGQTVFFVADKWDIVCDALGALRLKLGEELSLYDKKEFNFK